MTKTEPAIMDQRTDNRVQDTGDGEHNRSKIQRHGEGQVAFDDQHHVPRQTEQMRHLAYLVVDQRDIRRIDRNVAAYAAHGDTHIRFF